MDFEIIMDVKNVHLDEYTPAHEVIARQNEHFNALLDQAEKLDGETKLATVSGTTITWKHVALTGAGGSVSFLVCLICICLYYKCGIKVKLPEFGKLWTVSTEMEREIERQINRQVKDEVVNKQIRREVSRQIQDNFNGIIAENLLRIQDQAHQRSVKRERFGRTNRSNSLIIEEL